MMHETSELPRSQPTILVVEDDARMCRLIQRNLELHLPNARVLAVADGPHAWEVYSTANPDVVITGIMMPGFDGFELIRRIREQDRRTRILVASFPRYRDKALALGADLYLLRPFGATELLRAVKSLLAE